MAFNIYDEAGRASNTGEWTDDDLVQYESNLAKQTTDTRQDTMDWLYGTKWKPEDVNDQFYDDWRAEDQAGYDRSFADWTESTGFTAEDYTNNAEAKASGDLWASENRTNKGGYDYDVNEIDSVTGIQQGIIGEGSEYLDRAMMKARSNSSGGVFSSMASGAASGAMLDRSLEMAQADSDVQKYNEGAQTDRGKLQTQAAAGIAGKTQDSINTGIQQGREFIGNQFLNKQNAEIAQEQAKQNADIEQERMAIEQEYDLEDMEWDSYYERLGAHDAHKYAILQKEFASGLDMTAQEAKQEAEFNTELMKLDASMYKTYMDSMAVLLGSNLEGDAKTEQVAALQLQRSQAITSASKYSNITFNYEGKKPDAEDYFGDAPISPGEEGVMGPDGIYTGGMHDGQQEVWDQALAQFPEQAKLAQEYFDANETDDMTKADFDKLWQEAFSSQFIADVNGNPKLKPADAVEGPAVPNDNQTAVVDKAIEDHPTEAQEAVDYFNSKETDGMTQAEYDALWQESYDKFFNADGTPKTTVTPPVDTGDSVLDGTAPPTSVPDNNPTQSPGTYEPKGTQVPIKGIEGYVISNGDGSYTDRNGNPVNKDGSAIGSELPPPTDTGTESGITQATLDSWRQQDPALFDASLNTFNTHEVLTATDDKEFKDAVANTYALRDGFLTDVNGTTWDDIATVTDGVGSYVTTTSPDGKDVTIYKAEPVTVETVMTILNWYSNHAGTLQTTYNKLETKYIEETGHPFVQETPEWYYAIRQSAKVTGIPDWAFNL